LEHFCFKGNKLMKTFRDYFHDWRENFERYAIADIRKILDVDKLHRGTKQEKDNVSIGLILLTFIAIESLSGYYCGKEEADSDTRKSFIERFFPNSYKPYITPIVDLRDALTHDYGLAPSPQQIVMWHWSDEPHLKTCVEKGITYLSFSRARFAEDLLEAWKRYLAALRS
jgi:hypothetical protein